MAADWLKPTTTSLKANFPTEIRNGFTSLGKMDFSGDTNVPVGYMQYNHSTKKFEEYNGSAWLTSTLHDLIPNKTAADTISGSWDFSSASWLTLPTDVRLKAANTTFAIQSINNSDIYSLHLSSGSTVGRTRGAFLSLYGNEASGVPMEAYLSGGGAGAMFWAAPTWAQIRGSDPSLAGGGVVQVFAETDGASAGQVHFYSGTGASSKIRNRLTTINHPVEYEYAGTVSHYFAANKLWHNNDFAIVANTSAGADNRNIVITPCGYGAPNSSRAAWFMLSGINYPGVEAGRFHLYGRPGSNITVDDGASNLGTLQLQAKLDISGAVTMTAMEGQLTARSMFINNGFQLPSTQNFLSTNDLVNRGKFRIYIDGVAYAIPYCNWN
jgi:hypothetical protein